MNLISDFFSIKPAMTYRCLQLVWYAFLVERAIELFGLVLALYRSFRTMTYEAIIYYFMSMIYIVIVALLVRVLIEVAVVVLLRPSKADLSADS